MSTQQQGAKDKAQGLGPANNPNWDKWQREKYNTGYKGGK